MAERDKIRAALHHIPAHDRELWLRIGMAIKSQLGDAGFELWHGWSQSDGKVTVGTSFHEAKAHGWRDLPEGYLRLWQIIGNPRAEPPVTQLIPVSKSSWWEGVRRGGAIHGL